MSINISMAAIFTPSEKISEEEIAKILKEHQEWLEDKSKGKRADFTNKNMEGYDFSGKDLSYAEMTGAGIDRADFTGAKLVKARMDKVVGMEVIFLLSVRKKAHLSHGETVMTV